LDSGLQRALSAAIFLPIGAMLGKENWRVIEKPRPATLPWFVPFVGFGVPYVPGVEDVFLRMTRRSGTRR
jgi:hypothetical protein